MDDPITSIEDKKAWTDFGRQAYLIYTGAKDEGADSIEALSMVSAFYEGMFKGSKSKEDDDGNDDMKGR